MKQTAVQWLASNLGEHIVWEEKIIDLVDQALEMEKEQDLQHWIETWSQGYDSGWNNCIKKYNKSE